MATPQQCIYHRKPAVGLDLCHAGHPVCADDDAHIGHQLAPLPPPAKASRKETQPK